MTPDRDDRPYAAEFVLGLLDAEARAAAEHRLAADPAFALQPFVDALMHRSLVWLRRAQRFNRSVIDHARGLTEATVRAEMALDPDHDHPPLTDAQIRSLLRRRDALLVHVDALVARHGARNVYAW